jgi:hypothetical protein
MGKSVVRAKSPQFVLFRRGDEFWCAAPPDFQDISSDPTGWGETPESAIQKLIGDAEFRKRAKRRGWPMPGLEDFVEIPEPAAARAVFRAAVILANAYASVRSQLAARRRRTPGKRASHERFLPRDLRTGRRHHAFAQRS